MKEILPIQRGCKKAFQKSQVLYDKNNKYLGKIDTDNPDLNYNVAAYLVSAANTIEAQEAEIKRLREALGVYLAEHKKNAETQYFLMNRRIDKDTIVECDCEGCNTAQTALKGE